MRRLTTLPNASRVATAGLLLAALLAAGCGAQRTASDRDPSPPGSSANTLLGPGLGSLALDPLRETHLFHMPLAVGNRWDYVVRLRTRLISDGSPDVIEETESPWTSEIVGVQTLNEHEYFMQAEYDPRVVSRPPAPSFALRQDRTGLYDLDLFVLRTRSAETQANDDGLSARFESALTSAAAKSSHPAEFAAAAKRLAGRLALMSMPGRGLGLPGLRNLPGSPPAGGDGGAVRRGSPLPNEISLLVYPLFTGSKWLVRESPRFARVVETRESAHVPAGDFPAWRMRGFSELYGPHDVVNFWQASEGLVRITLRSETEAIDNEGRPIGLMIFEMDQSLSVLTLVPPTP